MTIPTGLREGGLSPLRRPEDPPRTSVLPTVTNLMTRSRYCRRCTMANRCNSAISAMDSTTPLGFCDESVRSGVRSSEPRKHHRYAGRSPQEPR